jgi:DNA-binding response OmpR family regulator
MEAQLPSALIVDDDGALRLLCRVNLELSGFGVREAASIAAAESAVAAERPDVVLLDVHLAGEDTLSLLDRLRLAGIPVALVTGSADPELYRHRADAVVPKPFDPQELVDVARRLARVDT